MKTIIDNVPLVWFAIMCFSMGVMSADASSNLLALIVFFILLIPTSIYIYYNN